MIAGLKFMPFPSRDEEGNLYGRGSSARRDLGIAPRQCPHLSYMNHGIAVIPEEKLADFMRDPSLLPKRPPKDPTR